MDGREHRRLDQPSVSQRHEVVVAVDEVKLSRMLEHFRDVEVFSDFGIARGILFISPVHYGMQMSAGHRIPGSEQGYIPAPRYQSFGNVAGHRLPGAIVPRRRSPGYRRQNRDSSFLAGNR